MRICPRRPKLWGTLDSTDGSHWTQSFWQLLRRRAQSAAQLTLCCLALGLASLVRPGDSSAQARDFTIRARPARGPQHGHSCKPDTRDLLQALNLVMLNDR